MVASGSVSVNFRQAQEFFMLRILLLLFFLALALNPTDPTDRTDRSDLEQEQEKRARARNITPTMMNSTGQEMPALPGIKGAR
jgi:hypothetical protein